MTTTIKLDDDKQYTIVVVQNREEARQVGTEPLLRAAILAGAYRVIPCRECGSSCWCSLVAWEHAQPHPYPACLACLGDALARFDNIDQETVSQGRKLSAAYKVSLALHKGRIHDDAKPGSRA